jgi:tight adherence protein C
MNAALVATGVLLVGATAWLIVRVAIFPRLRFEAHLRHVESYGFERQASDEPMVVGRGWLRPALDRLAASIGRRLMAAIPQLPAITRRDLTAGAHYEITPEAVHGYRAMAATIVPMLIVLYALGNGGLSAIGAVLTASTLVLSWQLPATLILRQARLRLDKIDRELPQFIDLLVATVEAGIGFGGALSGVANRFKGPLGDELQIAMRQQSLGISTDRALGDMLERCESPSMRAFVRAVLRAESHGVSIGPVMRHLAHDIRRRRRDLALEKIQKAPIKMLIPLVLFILLPLLMVILFPAMYNILHILAGTGGA